MTIRADIMHLLIPPPPLKLPARLLDPERTGPYPLPGRRRNATALNASPVALVTGRAGARGQAMRAETEVGWKGRAQLREEGGDVEDAEWQVPCVFGGGLAEG
jgi:hypothetical protein